MANTSIKYVLHKLWTRVIPNARYLARSRVRTCRACNRLSLFIAIGRDEEFHICIRCRANLRYELLASYLRSSAINLPAMDILELDPGSPLRSILSNARTYIPSFFRPNVEPGTHRLDGIVCQDITALALDDGSLDLIVSSDVLEHVPNPAAAFRETARVLRPGGVHIFTVPPRPFTQCRATLEGQNVVILKGQPEYHQDPLDPKGVLVFWDYGPDLPDVFKTPGLSFNIVQGPEGIIGRTVWEARKT